MKVYRITLASYSDRLFASGRPARWNPRGTFVIYTASTRSLACLENLVHRSGEGLDANFRTMIIHIPDDLPRIEIQLSELPENWKDFRNQPKTRTIGDEWVKEGKTALLKVPSAIIPEEYNYILNFNHPHFSRIKLEKVEPFDFDRRLY